MKVGDLVKAGNPDSAPGLVIKILKVIPTIALVLWPEEEYGFSYEESDVLEVISESR